MTSRAVSRCVREAMVLVVGAHHDVGSVERVASGIIIVESVLVGEHIPRIVHMKILEAEAQGEMNTGNGNGWHVLRHHLALGEPAMVLGKFSQRVRRVGRVNTRADFRDSRVIGFTH